MSEPTDNIPGGTVFTPQKAVRRITDHLVDHLAELEALLAGVEPIPDTWHGRTVTLASRLWSFRVGEGLGRARPMPSELAEAIRTHRRAPRAAARHGTGPGTQ